MLNDDAIRTQAFVEDATETRDCLRLHGRRIDKGR
jgi:hypothetical protein